jgi:hypothetical protein
MIIMNYKVEGVRKDAYIMFQVLSLDRPKSPTSC